MLTALLTLFVLGIAGLIVISVVMAVLGTVFSVAFGLVGILVFKVAPLLLIGWCVLKLIERRRGSKRLSSADQRWLDS